MFLQTLAGILLRIVLDQCTAIYVELVCDSVVIQGETKGMILNLFKRLMQYFPLLFLLVSVSACEGEKAPIRVASHVWPGYEFLSLGQQLGYLPEQKVTLVESRSATECIQLLKQGRADAATLTLDEVLLARSQGLDLTIILIMDISVGADQLITREGIDSLQQLKGKTIAVEQTAVGRLLLAKASEQAGLTLEDFSLLPATIDQHVDLWAEGKVDAVVTYEPSASKILRQNGHVIFDSSQVPETIVDVLAVRTDLIEEHSAMLHLLVSGFFKAQKHFLTNPQDAAYRMSDRLNVPSREVMYLYQGIELPSVEHNKKLLATGNPQLSAVSRDIMQLGLFPDIDETMLTKQLHSDKFLP